MSLTTLGLQVTFRVDLLDRGSDKIPGFAFCQLPNDVACGICDLAIILYAEWRSELWLVIFETTNSRIGAANGFSDQICLADYVALGVQDILNNEC